MNIIHLGCVIVYIVARCKLYYRTVLHIKLDMDFIRLYQHRYIQYTRLKLYMSFNKPQLLDFFIFNFTCINTVNSHKGIYTK